MAYVKNKNTKFKIYILCNGELAEPQYFQDIKNYFKLNTVKVVYKPFKDLCPWDFIEKSFEYKQKLLDEGNLNLEDGDQCWCVFDVDDYFKNNPSEFIKTVKKAEKNKLRLAYSNECFELWYLLHFQVLSSAIPRNEYHSKLKKHLLKHDGKNYSKNSEGMFARISDNVQEAIRNAKSLYEKGRFDKNPSTSIHLLIGEIYKLVEGS